MHTRTFRLFVSSTFSDFTEERKLLQTIVFPKIKVYCRNKKLVFQPIDLRWGVTDDASNDQKTLELCLDEVQTSKLHPYPNFLIMMGDRYGTVILPYAVEQKEFEDILYNVKNESDKDLLRTWYKLDVNQIPASYIIEQRKGSKESMDGVDYTDRKYWKPINKKLLEIFQNTVPKTNISYSEKKKYFASATEAEIIEGIFKYLDKTKFQEKQLKQDVNIESQDYENVYAYIRSIRNIDNIELETEFKDEDPKDVKFVKDEIEKSIDKDHIYSVDVDLINTQVDENGKLIYYYKELNDTEENFVTKMIEYLENSIDKFVAELAKQTDSKSEEEIKAQEEYFEQERFKDDKVSTFLEGSRKSALSKVDEYVKGANKQSLVIYGKSGLGKSALMAQAINNTIKQKSKKDIAYRFVGATSSLNDTPSLLISILTELGIKEEIRKTQNPQTGQEENEKLEEFYLRIHDHLKNFKGDRIIFIDAVDQLSNQDEFLWLPSKLLNLKIIISVLKDESYKDADGLVYFDWLKRKTDNLYQLEPFEDSKKLVENILERYDRTITDNQMEYLLSQDDSSSPLYLTVAAQQVRHWKARDKDDKKFLNQTLAPTQKEIISEYIDNLTKLFHHDKEFIKRVFSYLYLTNGLSETELLEILNEDSDFISEIAPDTHHKKELSELPIVIWARLHFQIKEFLKLEETDGYETMKFFHREFDSCIIKIEESKILKRDIKRLIIQHQDDVFEANRWGKLFITLTDGNDLDGLEKLYNNVWIRSYLKYIKVEASNTNDYAFYNSKVLKFYVNFSSLMFEKDRNEWFYYYSDAKESELDFHDPYEDHPHEHYILAEELLDIVEGLDSIKCENYLTRQENLLKTYYIYNGEEYAFEGILRNDTIKKIKTLVEEDRYIEHLKEIEFQHQQAESQAKLQADLYKELKKSINNYEQNNIISIEALSNIASIGELDLNFVINPEAIADDVRTPLSLAVELGIFELVELFISCGAHTETINIDPNGSVLFFAVKNNDDKLLEFLLESGANPLQESSWGETPLEAAAKVNSDLYSKILKYVKISKRNFDIEELIDIYDIEYKWTFSDLLLIAKGLSIENDQSKKLQIVDLVMAIDFVELSSAAERVFKAVFEDVKIKKLNLTVSGPELINIAKDYPKIMYDDQMRELVEKLQEVFEDDRILNIREKYIDFNEDEIPF